MVAADRRAMLMQLRRLQGNLSFFSMSSAFARGTPPPPRVNAVNIG